MIYGCGALRRWRALPVAKACGMAGKRSILPALSGGPNRKGQVWRYMPSLLKARPQRKGSQGVGAFCRAQRWRHCRYGRQSTIAPGDVILCEDGPENQYLVGVTPEGQFYKLGHNAYNHSELGIRFLPDGQTLYVNIQKSGITLAIRGPWV